MYKIPVSLRSDSSHCRFARIECHFAPESVPISSEYASERKRLDPLLTLQTGNFSTCRYVPDSMRQGE
jgi:hypothetical protein